MNDRKGHSRKSCLLKSIPHIDYDLLDIHIFKKHESTCVNMCWRISSVSLLFHQISFIPGIIFQHNYNFDFEIR